MKLWKMEGGLVHQDEDLAATADKNERQSDQNTHTAVSIPIVLVHTVVYSSSSQELERKKKISNVDIVRTVRENSVVL